MTEVVMGYAHWVIYEEEEYLNPGEERPFSHQELG